MPSFIHPSLLWGLALVAVPVLIHLINLVRRRRVAWAAMEFLLASERRRRHWVWLEQLLLLLCRMAAVAGLVLLVARPVLDSRWLAGWGTNRTQHVVLLDDSYSLRDRASGDSAWQAAQETLRRLGTALAAQRSPQAFTLLRFSRAAGEAPRPDWQAEPVTADFPARLAQLVAGLEPAAGAWGPDSALEALERLFEDGGDEARVLYLVSDFRHREWREPGPLVDRLRQWAAAGGEIELVSCAARQSQNLAVTQFAAIPANRAAGVPQRFEVTVTNFGPEPSAETVVELWEDDQPRPALGLGRIAPGQSATRRFEATFGTAGDHTLTAALAGDALELDNRRWTTVDVPLENPLLIVAADDDASDATFLARALAPGGRVRTGLGARIEPAARLDRERLERWRAIFLADPGPLPAGASERLEEYLRQGGSLAVFVGEQTPAAEINAAWYRGGAGFFPAAVLPPVDLVDDQLDGVPDLDPGDDPLFRVFAGERNSFLASVAFRRYLPLAEPLSADDPAAPRVLARLRNGAPLVLERKFGAGRVVAVLSTAAPEWNNWARNPSYVVWLLELVANLTTPREEVGQRLVGQPLEVPVDLASDLPRVEWEVPRERGGNLRLATDARPAVAGAVARLDETAAPGVYAARVSRSDGELRRRLLAVNVDPAEGDLALWPEVERERALADVPHRWQAASEFTRSARERAGWNATSALVAAIVALLVGEQWLAYRASYHPSPGRRR